MNDAKKGYGGKKGGGGKRPPKMADQPGRDNGQCPPTPASPVRQRAMLAYPSKARGY